MLLTLLFKPLGFLKSLPNSHTFFGAFCWGLRLLYGEDRLRRFLEDYKSSPPVIFSSLLFREGGKLYFPKPASLGLKIDLRSLDNREFSAYRKYKKLKSLSFVPEEVLRDFLMGNAIDYEKLFQEEKSFFAKALVPHASINRLTSTTTGGELFFESIFATGEFCLLVKINRWEFEEKPEELLPAIYNLLPLGGNKSTGMGLFNVSLLKTPEWLSQYTEKAGDYFYSLSDFFYSQNIDLQESYYEVEVKRPAVENYFGRHGNLLWKKPMPLIKAGAVMKVRDSSGYYGKLKQISHNLYHYGYAFPLYLRGGKPC